MKRAAIILAILGLFAVFVAGIVQLLNLRFREGDIYPPYSSLRSDPLGTKVLYQALAELLPAKRNFRSLDRLQSNSEGATLFYAGLRYKGLWPADTQGKLEQLARPGGRLILTFLPKQETKSEEDKRLKRARELERRFGKSRDRKKSSPTPFPDPSKEKKEDPEDEHEHQPYITTEEFTRGWQMEFSVLEQNEAREDMNATFEFGQNERASVSWHSTLYFEKLSPQWKIIARCNEKPVVIERAFGKGTIVAATDSFFLSNEAMRTERHPKLLSWVVGNAKQVIFDEAHLAVSESPGIANLARKYRLHGLAVVLVIVAGLFVWRNATSLLPPQTPSDKSEGSVRGRDAASGVVNLLRRNVRQRDLLRTCLLEWQRALHRKLPASMHQRVEQIASKPEIHPVEAYRAIAQILSERKL